MHQQGGMKCYCGKSGGFNLHIQSNVVDTPLHLPADIMCQAFPNKGSSFPILLLPPKVCLWLHVLLLTEKSKSI